MPALQPLGDPLTVAVPRPYASPCNRQRASHIVHDSPKLTFALILDCVTESSTTEFGSRATESKHGMHWDSMIADSGSFDRRF